MAAGINLTISKDLANPAIAAGVLTNVRMEPESDDGSLMSMITITSKGTHDGTTCSEHFRSPCKCRKCGLSFILSLKADVPDEVFTQLSGIDQYLVTTATKMFEKTELL